MTVPPTEHVAEYRNRIVGRLHEVYGRHARIRCLSTRALGYSISFRFVVDRDHGPAETLFAKVRRASKFGGYEAINPESKTARLGRLEYLTLERAHAWFSNRTPDLGVVKPVTYVEECHALVVTAAEGMAVDEIARRRHPLQLAAVSRAGRWLRHFHLDVADPVTRGWQAAPHLARFAKMRAALIEAGADEALVSSFCERIAAQAGRLDGAPCVHTLAHGDYKLRHIWTTPTRMEVLDFGNVHTAPVVEDLAAFLVELEVGEFAAVRPPLPGAAALSAAFLGAYGPIDSPATLAVQLVLARMKKWARRRVRPSSTPAARRVQRWLRLTGTDELARRQLIDPFFTARIESEIAWLERRASSAAPALPYTGTLAEVMSLPLGSESA